DRAEDGVERGAGVHAGGANGLPGDVAGGRRIGDGLQDDLRAGVAGGAVRAGVLAVGSLVLLVELSLARVLRDRGDRAVAVRGGVAGDVDERAVGRSRAVLDA